MLTIVHLYNYKEKIHLDNGAGINRKNIWLVVLQFKDELFDVFVSDSKFQTFLSALGACAELSQEIADGMEEFVRRLYGF